MRLFVLSILVLSILDKCQVAGRPRSTAIADTSSSSLSSSSSSGRSINLTSCETKTRLASGGWRYRTSPSLRARDPLLWISSQEGLLSHYFQAEKLWRIVVLQHRRPLVIAPFLSYKHYGDVLMRLCDYFVMPADVLCVSRPQRLATLSLPARPQESCRCKILTSNDFSSLQQYVNFKNLTYFQLSSETCGGVVNAADFGSESCLAGFVDDLNGFPEPPAMPIVPRTGPNAKPGSIFTVYGKPVGSAVINITATPGSTAVLRNQTVPVFPVTSISSRYMSLVPVLRAALGVEGTGVALANVPKLRPFISGGTGGSATRLTVVHWRRGDYLVGPNSRCSRRLDTSVNCNTTAEFISEVKRLCKLYRYERRGRKNVVYVATNEADPASLALLQRHGFRVKSDLQRGLDRIVREANAGSPRDALTLWDIFPLALPLNAADDFAIDIALVCTAEGHIHFGYSNYNKFISRCRPRMKGK